jgi:hypothetical protein
MSQDNDAELVAHPHSMQLWGDAAAVRFPPLCANCGRPAHNRLTYKKRFLRDSDSDTPNSWVTTLVKVPFCDACIAQHKADGPGASVIANIGSRLLTGAHLLGTAGFALAAAVAGYFALSNLWHQHLKLFYSLALLTGFLLIVAWGLYQILRDGTEEIRAQGQSSMTQAFDFSDSTAAPFRSATFICTMRNESFAAAFRALNQAQEFDPDSAAAAGDAQSAKRKFWITALVIGTLALIGHFLGKE